MNSPNESECKSTAFFSYDKIFLQKNSKKTHFFIFFAFLHPLHGGEWPYKQTLFAQM
jgi:hypothetical protein